MRIIIIALTLCFSCHLPLLNGAFPGGTLIEVKRPGTADTYYFCKDNTVRVRKHISSYLNHKRFGTFSQDGDAISIVWNRELGTKGVGKKFGCSDGECVYSNYRPFQKHLYQEERFDLKSLRATGEVSIEAYQGVCDPFRSY